MTDHSAIPGNVPCCWSCLKPFTPERLERITFVTLDGSGKPHVCQTCWRKLPEWMRVALVAIANDLHGCRGWLERLHDIGEVLEGPDAADWWKRFQERGEN